MNYLSLLCLLIINKLWSQFKAIFPTACLTLRSSAMAFSCSFQRITGTDCSFDRLDKLPKRYFESLFSLVIFWIDSGKGNYSCYSGYLPSERDSEITHDLPTPQVQTWTWLAVKLFQVHKSYPQMEQIEKWNKDFENDIGAHLEDKGDVFSCWTRYTMFQIKDNSVQNAIQ